MFPGMREMSLPEGPSRDLDQRQPSLVIHTPVFSNSAADTFFALSIYASAESPSCPASHFICSHLQADYCQSGLTWAS
jgi:hypothetical protein